MICPYMSKFVLNTFLSLPINPLSTGLKDDLTGGTVKLNLLPVGESAPVPGSPGTLDAPNDIGSTIPDAFMLYHNCLTSECGLWDSINERCGVKVTDFILGNPTERDHNSIISYLRNIIGTDDEKISAEGTGSSLLKELNHMHGAHWHPSPHECYQIPVSCGHSNAGFASFGTPYATVLIAEFMSSQDLDNNGFIYGRDFMISESADKPIMLKPIESSPEWIDPDISIDWEPLLKWSKCREPEDEYSSLIQAPDPLEPYRS